MKKIIIIDRVHCKYEDSGQAMIATMDDPLNPIFVRLHSWDETKQHEIMSKLEGKMVKITIEALQ